MRRKMDPEQATCLMMSGFAGALGVLIYQGVEALLKEATVPGGDGSGSAGLVGGPLKDPMLVAQPWIPGNKQTGIMQDVAFNLATRGMSTKQKGEKKEALAHWWQAVSGEQGEDEQKEEIARTFSGVLKKAPLIGGLF